MSIFIRALYKVQVITKYLGKDQETASNIYNVGMVKIQISMFSTKLLDIYLFL